MNIVLLGTGNVARVLGEKLRMAGHRILVVAGRNAQKAEALGNILACPHVRGFDNLPDRADLFLMAVSDDAIPELAAGLRLEGQLVVHTAGSVSREVLAPVSSRYGVLYPLQSLKGREPASGKIPLLLDAKQDGDRLVLSELAASIGSSWQHCNDQQRLHMHLAAVWANNFTNYMYSIAYRICRENSVGFELILPLISETSLRVSREVKDCISDPFIWQTGPAIRNDQTTMKKHLELLSSQPGWQELYRNISAGIHQMSIQDPPVIQ